jgi:hypothetical protein
MRSLVALLVTAVVLALSSTALADPKSEDKGCHGFYTTQAKELTGERGVQGDAIGGNGNSDGNPNDGQAHMEPGRGATLQAFLDPFCGVGSQK